MRAPTLFAYAVSLSALLPTAADAQLLDQMIYRTEQDAVSALENAVDHETHRAMRCAMSEETCIRAAPLSEVEEPVPEGATNAPTPASLLPGTSGAVMRPLVSLPLNGSLDNVGNASRPQLFAPYGSTRPDFVPGHTGMALSFRDGGAVTIPFEFNQRQYPQATVTMWVWIEKASHTDRDLFSVGFGSGLRVRLTSDGAISVRSGGKATHPHSIPTGQWVFVSVVVDNDMGFARIQQDDDAHLEMFGENRSIATIPARVPGSQVTQHHIFVGAEDFDGAIAATRPIMLDDVRLYAGALSTEQIMAVRRHPQ